MQWAQRLPAVNNVGTGCDHKITRSTRLNRRLTRCAHICASCGSFVCNDRFGLRKPRRTSAPDRVRKQKRTQSSQAPSPYTNPLKPPPFGDNQKLPDQDSNLDKQNQNLLCYRYTIGHRCAWGVIYRMDAIAGKVETGTRWRFLMLRQSADRVAVINVMGAAQVVVPGDFGGKTQ